MRARSWTGLFWGMFSLCGLGWGCDAIFGVDAPTLLTSSTGGQMGTGGTTSSGSASSGTTSSGAASSGGTSSGGTSSGGTSSGGTSSGGTSSGSTSSGTMSSSSGGCSTACDTPPTCHGAGTCNAGVCDYPLAPGVLCDGGTCDTQGHCQGCGGSGCTMPFTACFNSPGTCNGTTCAYGQKAMGEACGNGYTCSASGSCGTGCSCPAIECYVGLCINGPSNGCISRPAAAGTKCGLLGLGSCNGNGSCG